MKEKDIVVFSETAEDEALLDKAESALSQARSATKNIKYDDSALNIMVELSSIVDELGVEEVRKELEYFEDQVREANNKLESAVYGLEEPFEDLIRTLRNKIDDEEMDRQDQEWEDQKRREQEQESKLVAPTAKGKKMLDHMREPLVDDVTLLDPAIDAEFINWIKEKSQKQLFPFKLGDLQDPKVLLKLKQEYHKETDRYAGDGGNLKHGTPRNRRAQAEEGAHSGYYLAQKAADLWHADNPDKKRDGYWRAGTDVQDEYAQKAGGKKGKYLGKGASEWTREDKEDMSITTTEKAAEILHDIVEPILDSFESRDEIEAYMTNNMPKLGRDYEDAEAINQAFELLPITGDAMPTENTKDEVLPKCELCKGKGCDACDNTGEDDGYFGGTKEYESIISGPTRLNFRLNELSPVRDNSANENKVADLIRSALTNPRGKDVYELFAELESINPELADLYKDVALHQYEVQIEESLNELKRWQGIAAMVAILAGLLGINNKLAQKAYDSSHQLQQLTQMYAVAHERDDKSKMKELRIRINNHKGRLDLGKGDVDFDGRPGNDDIKDLDYMNPVGDRGGADFRFPGDPDQQQEAQKPTTSSKHSTERELKKYDPAHGHTKPEGGKPGVCSCITSSGPSTDCAKCGGSGEIITPKRNDPKVESLKWKPGSDKKSWWDK